MGRHERSHSFIDRSSSGVTCRSALVTFLFLHSAPCSAGQARGPAPRRQRTAEPDALLCTFARHIYTGVHFCNPRPAMSPSSTTAEPLSVAAFTAPGQPFELIESVVRGARCRIFRHAPRSLAQLYPLAQ